MPANRHRATVVTIDQLPAAPPREFVLSQADFQTLTRLAYEHAGISLSEGKQNLIYSRLARRLRALGLESFRHYCNYLAATPGEVENFINAISTNHTKFFREAHHFEHFRTHVAVPFARAAARKAGGRLRVWSAGCSSGEEPYTIAMILKSEVENIGGNDVRVLATDIDTDVLAKAANAQFSAGAIDEVPKPYRGFFTGSADVGANGKLVIDNEVQTLIAFRRLNLLGPWPFHGLFDAIFCRNVMIYFDAPTKAALIDRFIQQIKAGGWLYVGHSESLIGTHSGLQLVGRTIYRRET